MLIRGCYCIQLNDAEPGEGTHTVHISPLDEVLVAPGMYALLCTNVLC